MTPEKDLEATHVVWTISNFMLILIHGDVMVGQTELLTSPGPEVPGETIEGWPLLTVETEVNGDSKRTNVRGPSLVGSLGMLCRYKIFLFCLDCSSQPSTKYYFPHRTLFHFISAHRPGHAGVLGRLSLVS